MSLALRFVAERLLIASRSKIPRRGGGKGERPPQPGRAHQCAPQFGLEPGRRCWCVSDTAAAGATDLRRRGRTWCIAAIATSSRLLAGRSRVRHASCPQAEATQVSIVPMSHVVARRVIAGPKEDRKTMSSSWLAFLFNREFPDIES